MDSDTNFPISSYFNPNTTVANAFKKLSDSDRNPTATLYFGNIDPQVTELLMYELFIQFGTSKINQYAQRSNIKNTSRYANAFKKLSDSDRNPTATLYFGNIDPQVTELLMYELFIQFGTSKINQYAQRSNIKNTSR
ncbi:sap49, partial [[Candida] subhashii]